MSKLTSQAEIQRGLIPIDEELMPSSKGIVSDRGMHIPDLDMIDAKNVLPTTQGYTSFFGVTDTLEDVGNALSDDVQKILTYKTLHGDAIQIAFCANGLWMRSLVGDAVGTLTNVPAAGGSPEYDKLDLNDKKCKWTQILSTIPISPWKMWTYCLMENALLVFQKGMDFIGRITSYEPEQIIFEHLTPTYILANRKRHTFTYTSEDDSTGDDTYKSITITTDTGLNFGTQKIAVDSASDVALAIEAWQSAFHNTGLFTTDFTETLRNEVDIDAFIPLANMTSAEIQTVIDNTIHNGTDSELELITALRVGSPTYIGAEGAFTETSTPTGFWFKPDGLEVYIAGGGSIWQYTLSTSWDLSTRSYTGVGSIVANDPYTRSVIFSPDGTRCFTLGGDSSYRYIIQSNLSIAWDITTIAYSSNFYVGTQEGSVGSLAFSTDGTKAYIYGLFTRTVYQYTLTTAWDLSTISYSGNSLDLSADITANSTGMHFSSDGLTLYLYIWAGNYLNTIRTVNLSTAWDITTGSYGGIYYTTTEINAGHEIYLNSTTNILYILEYLGKYIHKYSTAEYGVKIAGFKKEFPTVISYNTNATFISPSDDSNDIAVAIRNLYLADATLAPNVGVLDVTQAATCDLHYTFTVTFTLLDSAAIPSSVETQDGTSVFTEDSLSSLVLPMGHIAGIASGRSRLIAWDEDDGVYQSSATNLVDFTPSAQTGANQITITSLKGKIVKIEGWTQGFIVYGSGNVVVATYAKSTTSIYNYKPIEEAEGLVDYRHLASMRDTHYYWSSKGLVQLNPERQTAEYITTEITDWIKKHRYPIQVHLISNRFLVLYIQDRDEVFSNRIARNGGTAKLAIREHPSLSPVEFGYISPGANLYPTYQRALIFDTQLEKWGTCDVPCKLLVSLTPYNQSGYQLAKNYQLLDAVLDNEQREIAVRLSDGFTYLATTFPTDSYVLFGHYATHRTNKTKLVGIETEYVDYPDATIEIEKSDDGAKVDFTQNVSYAQSLLKCNQGFSLAASWFNILIKGGHFHLKRLLVKGYTYGR